MADNWNRADIAVPNHELMVEIAAFVPDNNPPFWQLSHAWYSQRLQEWVRKHGQNWEIEYWRDTEATIGEQIRRYRNRHNSWRHCLHCTKSFHGIAKLADHVRSEHPEKKNSD